jgi:CPA1 family monovalent cation:H+ antiporter
VILLTFGIVFVTLVGQGLTLPRLIRALRIETDTSGETEAELAREAMRRAAVQAVDELVAEHGLPAHEAVTVKRFFGSRSPRGGTSALAPDSEARLWLGATAAQRKALLDLWRRGEIGDDVLIRLERELDLAEARLAGE